MLFFDKFIELFFEKSVHLFKFEFQILKKKIENIQTAIVFPANSCQLKTIPG